MANSVEGLATLIREEAGPPFAKLVKVGRLERKLARAAKSRIVRPSDILCPCGSHVVSKACCFTLKHGERKVGIRCERLVFRDLRAAQIQGFVQFFDTPVKHAFQATARHENDGAWSIDQAELRFLSTYPCPFNILYELDAQSNLDKVLRELGGQFKVLAIEGVPETDRTFKIRIHHVLVADKALNASITVVRPEILGSYRPQWDHLWEAVMNRAEHDPQFRVTGFSREQVVLALVQIQRWLPVEWIRAKYARALNASSAEVTMWQDIGQESDCWFPVAHLVRVANGFLCKDAPLNALVSLGLQVGTIMSFVNGQKMLERVGQQGLLFQSMLAARFARLNLLIDVERVHGSTQDDLVVSIGAQEVGIEVKTVDEELLSNRWIARTVTEKAKKLPRKPARPVILCVFPIRSGKSKERIEELLQSKAKETTLDEIVADLDSLQFCWSPKICAVSIHTMFVEDRSAEPFITIEKAFVSPEGEVSVTEQVLRAAFMDDRPACPVRARLPAAPNFVMPTPESDPIYRPKKSR